uniref:Mini-chromosome maintenance complex-binding protein n=2 Tax=Hirondellea gigas TaxID=1518452 RepID=A0A2P2HXN0_9CRUS
MFYRYWLLTALLLLILQIFSLKMPGILDWILDPLAIVDNIYEECEGKDGWQTKVEEYFSSKLQNESTLNKVPSIPETPLHQLKDAQLVRFRCQMQDQYDPEYYVETYVVERPGGAIRTRTSRYRELYSLGIGEKIIEQESTGQFAQRCVSYCITLPGQNDWVTQEISALQSVPLSQQCSNSGHKRSLDEDDTDSMDTQAAPSQADENKRARAAAEDSNNNSSRTAAVASSSTATAGASPGGRFNFPIRNDKGIACLVKFYIDSEENEYGINDLLDVVGVICLNPSLAAMVQDDDSNNVAMINMTDTRGPAARMPPSLVPRLHALATRVMQHPHPSLPPSPPLPAPSEMREARELLRGVLEEACLGDPLAGDYIISNLIGTVYSRQDLHVLGQYPLNISGITPVLSTAGFTTKLYQLLQQLTTHSHFLSLTTENINTITFIPKKDYSSNELQSGLLQLPGNTLLVMDETAMEPGQLQTEGLQNLEQVGNVLRNQKCKYDFQFHKIEMDTNINALILSEGRSMLPNECELVLCPQHHDVAAAFDRVQSLLNPEALTTIRKYISTARLYDYQLSQQMQEELQNEFVEARQESKDSMTPEKFHELLVLARLVAVSCGEQELTQCVWRSCKILDTKRMDRIKALNRQSRATTVGI